MSRVVLIIAAIISLGFGNKKDKLEIWTKQTTIAKVVDFEKSLNKGYEFQNMNVSLSKEIYPLVNNYSIPNPIIVKRKQTGFLPLFANYFYSEPDSILRYISYDWERDSKGNIFTMMNNIKEEKNKKNEYNAEYEIIKALSIKQFGEPLEQKDEFPITNSSSGNDYYLERSTTWETDSTYTNLNMFCHQNTYRIRLYYYWK